MKSIIYTLTIFIALFSISCDKITDIEEKDEVLQKILIEEFSGYICGNCPAALEEANRLQKKYKGRVIISTIHAGVFASPGTGVEFDFRNTTGNELNSKFRVIAFPTAMINREIDNSKNRLFLHGKWEENLKPLLEKKAPIKLDLTANYTEATRTIKVNVKIEYLVNGSENDNIVLHLSEDKVYALQKDSRKTPVMVENFEHNNLLRGGITATFGDLISPVAPVKGDIFNLEYTYVIPEDKNWNPQNLKVLGYVLDGNPSTMHIKQVEEAPLYPVK